MDIEPPPASSLLLGDEVRLRGAAAGRRRPERHRVPASSASPVRRVAAPRPASRTAGLVTGSDRAATVVSPGVRDTQRATHAALADARGAVRRRRRPGASRRPMRRLQEVMRLPKGELRRARRCRKRAAARPGRSWPAWARALSAIGWPPPTSPISLRRRLPHDRSGEVGDEGVCRRPVARNARAREKRSPGAGTSRTSS